MTKEEILTKIAEGFVLDYIKHPIYSFNVTNNDRHAEDVIKNAIKDNIDIETIRNLFDIIEAKNNTIYLSYYNDRIIHIEYYYLDRLGSMNKEIPLDLFLRYLNVDGITKTSVKKISKYLKLDEDTYLENYELFRKFDISGPKTDSVKLRKILDDSNAILEEQLKNAKYNSIGLKKFMSAPDNLSIEYYTSFKMDKILSDPDGLKKVFDLSLKIIQKIMSTYNVKSAENIVSKATYEEKRILEDAYDSITNTNNSHSIYYKYLEELVQKVLDDKDAVIKEMNEAILKLKKE